MSGKNYVVAHRLPEKVAAKLRAQYYAAQGAISVAQAATDSAKAAASKYEEALQAAQDHAGLDDKKQYELDLETGVFKELLPDEAPTPPPTGEPPLAA